MTERKPFQFKKFKEKEYEPVHLPPAWCGSICRNAMNEICVEDCAIKRDCSAFEQKPNLKLGGMPRFPETKNMTREEKFTSVTIYLSKVVDHLQGVDDERTNYPPLRRQNLHSTGNRYLPEDFKVEDLLSGVQERDTSPENRKERQDSPSGSSEVVGQTSQAT